MFIYHFCAAETADESLLSRPTWLFGGSETCIFLFGVALLKHFRISTTHPVRFRSNLIAHLIIQLTK